MRGLWAGIRFVGAAAIIAAIVAQFLRSLEIWTADPMVDLAYRITSFFSFFTIESNIVAAAALLIGAILLVGGRSFDARWFATLRLCATSYMTVTLVVYNVLLRGIELPQGATVAWSNEILHVVGPLIVIADWLVGPGRLRLPWSAIIAVVAFPLVWTAYTLVRGAFFVDPATGIPWYPYPFLDPAQPGGYLPVVAYVIGIAALFALVGVGAIAVSRKWAPLARDGVAAP